MCSYKLVPGDQSHLPPPQECQILCSQIVGQIAFLKVVHHLLGPALPKDISFCTFVRGEVVLFLCLVACYYKCKILLQLVIFGVDIMNSKCAENL